nr:hypothetical protein [Candidatus Sigynarchaeota archaeon]
MAAGRETVFVLSILFNILLFVELIAFATILFLVAMRHRKTHVYGFTSSLVSSFQVAFIAVAVLVLGLIPYPYIGFMSWWTWTWLAVTAGFFFKARKRLGKPKLVNGAPVNDDPGQTCNDGLKYQHEKARKAFHLAGFLVILCYFVVAPFLLEAVMQAINYAGDAYAIVWGPISEVQPFPSMEAASITLTLFALIGTVILVMLIDSYRLFAGDEYSIIKLIEKKAGKIMRDKEKGCPGAQDYIAISSACTWLVGMGFHPVLPEAMMITLAAVLISTLADGAAAIIGKSFGRHKVTRPYNQVKSIEGFIAG